MPTLKAKHGCEKSTEELLIFQIIILKFFYGRKYGCGQKEEEGIEDSSF